MNKRSRYYTILAVAVVCWLVGVPYCINDLKNTPVETQTADEKIVTIEPINLVFEPEVLSIKSKESVPLATDEEIDLLALVTMAEAEGEPEEGQRLVIDTILNRVDSRYFPNTIHDVIYQPHQFTSMWNGRVDRCSVRDDIRNLVIEELQNRSNTEVVFFRTSRYSSYGTPLFQVGNHYFSKY
jgi:N-acetylmuramoyl-L-alanine amidase